MIRFFNPKLSLPPESNEDQKKCNNAHSNFLMTPALNNNTFVHIVDILLACDLFGGM